MTGASAGCAVNKSIQNRKYDGFFMVETPHTQSQLKAAVKAGKFTFHKVGTDVRVLEDINTMVTTSDTMGDVFKDNQTIRVIDQIGNDIAVLFNTKYLGVVPNDAPGGSRCGRILSSTMNSFRTSGRSRISLTPM